MAIRGITLQPYFQERYVTGDVDGYRWRVDVEEARGVPAAIFLYKKVPTALYAPGTGGAEPPVETAWAGEFNGVASPADLEEYPEGEPRMNDFPPFYRLDWVDQVFRGKIQAMAAYIALIGAIRDLVYSLDVQDELAARDRFTIGDAMTVVPGQAGHSTNTLIAS